jgi:hypothetical protein
MHYISHSPCYHRVLLGSATAEAARRSLLTAETRAESQASLNLNTVNQLIFVMVKCGVLFEVRTDFLNNI